VSEREIELANMQFNGYFATIIGARWENKASEVTTPVNHPRSILNYRSHYKRVSASHLTTYRTFPEPLKYRRKFLEKCNSSIGNHLFMCSTHTARWTVCVRMCSWKLPFRTSVHFVSDLPLSCSNVMLLIVQRDVSVAEQVQALVCAQHHRWTQHSQRWLLRTLCLVLERR
jgi:hypothetical protein